jgi:hypothetical protein
MWAPLLRVGPTCVVPEFAEFASGRYRGAMVPLFDFTVLTLAGRG